MDIYVDMGEGKNFSGQLVKVIRYILMADCICIRGSVRRCIDNVKYKVASRWYWKQPFFYHVPGMGNAKILIMADI